MAEPCEEHGDNSRQHEAALPEDNSGVASANDLATNDEIVADPQENGAGDAQQRNMTEDNESHGQTDGLAGVGFH